MAKTSMPQIANIIGQVARLDRRGKKTLYEYLAQDLGNETYTLKAEEVKVGKYKEGTEK